MKHFIRIYAGPFDISDNCRMIARAVVPRPDAGGEGFIFTDEIIVR